MFFKKKYLIGQELVRRGKLTQDNLDFALIEHENKGGRLGHILIKCGFIQEMDLLEVLSDQFQLPIEKNLSEVIEKGALEKIPSKLSRELKFIPVREDADTFTVCISEPLEVKEIEKIENSVHKKVKMVINSDKNVLKMIKQHYGLTDDKDIDFLDEDED